MGLDMNGWYLRIRLKDSLTTWSKNKCYAIDYNNTTLAKVESMIKVYHTLLKQQNWNLNTCDLDKIDLDRHDMCQDVVGE
jgi:hypothetical protein